MADTPSARLRALLADRLLQSSRERTVLTELLAPLGLAVKAVAIDPSGDMHLTVTLASDGAPASSTSPAIAAAAPAEPKAAVSGAAPLSIPQAAAVAPAKTPTLPPLPPAAPTGFGSAASDTQSAPASTPAAAAPAASPAAPPPIPGRSAAGSDISIALDGPVATIDGRSGNALRVPRAPVTETRRNPFLASSGAPEERAHRLARTLISDIIAYRPADHEAALAQGPDALHATFDPLIATAREHFHREVDGVAVPSRDQIFQQALVELLARGAPWF